MRCKKHLHDLTSTIGVCASCLRDRLQPLLEAQAQAQSQHARVCPRSSDDLQNPDHDDSVGLNFPRSVSPYVSRRKTDRDRRVDRSFYSTPQAGPTFSDGGKTPSLKKRLDKFWILSNLFQSRSNKSEISSRESCDPSAATATASPSWFSTILTPRRQNRRRDCEHSNNGISTEVNFTDKSPQRRQNTAEARRRWRLGSAGKRVTGMGICLSPLVGASPKRQWRQKGDLIAPVVVGGAHNNIYYCGNRSKKLADFGRVTTHNYY